MKKPMIHKVLYAVRAPLDWLAAAHWRSFTLIFILSFVIRLNEVNQIPMRFLVPDTSYELTAIAISLMETGEFANAYMIPTGPAAHLPPIYPFITSIIYHLFGLTATAGIVSYMFMFTANSVLLALLPWFAGKLGIDRQAGVLGGIAGALTVEWAGHGEYLSGIAIGLILVAFLRRWRGKTISVTGALLTGLGIGAAFHIQPALLSVVIGCLAFELWWRGKQQKKTYMGVLVLGILLACIPWGWRNYQAFDAVFFIRSNFGLELRMGNHDGAVATWAVMDKLVEEHRHPKCHFGEVKLLKEMGEAAYMRQAGREALDWILANPGEYTWLSMQRFANLWAGPLDRPRDAFPVFLLTFLAFWGAWKAFSILSSPQRAAIIIPLLTYPLVYYFVLYMPRYRIPVNWLLYLLAGSAVWYWIGGRQKEGV